MIRAILLLPVTFLALATDPGDPPTPGVSTGTTPGGFWGSATSGGLPKVGSPPSAHKADPIDDSGPHIVLGIGACTGADGLTQTATNSPASVTFCPGTTPTPQPTLTLADIRHAFAELPLPTPTLVIQPPDGLTLVNFDTNFYTAQTQPLIRTVTLLGQRVTIRATPAAYTWTYGDGASRTTADPGAPYPDLRVTHRYERKGAYRTRLAVTYDGAYRLGGGGPWRAIPGRVTRTGAPQGLRVVEATPTLVGY